MEAKITAIAPWFGSKRSMASTIVTQLGKHSAYWEVFCGSCAVLFRKPSSTQETVCDLHGELINLAMVLASDRAIQLYELCARTLYSDVVYKACRNHFNRIETSPPRTPDDVTDDDVSNAWLYMVMSWMGRNGTSGTARTNYQMAVRWTPNGGSGPTRWKNAVESIPEWHQRLRNVCILRANAFDVLSKIDDSPKVAIYADPPYLIGSRSSGGGSMYRHDFDGMDHQALAASLQRFKASRVVVSYYDDPKLDELYPGWEKIDCTRQKNLHVQNRRGSSKSDAPEVLLVNGPVIEELSE